MIPDLEPPIWLGHDEAHAWKGGFDTAVRTLTEKATLITSESGDNVGVFIPINTWRMVAA